MKTQAPARAIDTHNNPCGTQTGCVRFHAYLHLENRLFLVRFCSLEKREKLRLSATRSNDQTTVKMTEPIDDATLYERNQRRAYFGLGCEITLATVAVFFRQIYARRHVCLGNDPNHLIIIIHERNSAQLIFSHRIQRLLQIIASEAGNYLVCHYYLRFRGFLH
jgi:hypothetical protein